jgi:hypothetical protein
VETVTRDLGVGMFHYEIWGRNKLLYNELHISHRRAKDYALSFGKWSGS